MRIKLALLITTCVMPISILIPGMFPYVQAGTQASYYVSPSGNDSNAGTSSDLPFKTLAKARDMVRTINSSMTGDIYVYLMDGTHTLSSTLSLGPSDSGTNGYNVIYKAYTGASPVISGGTDITNGWTMYDSGKNIYKKTGVNWNFRQLYVNNLYAIRARAPNVTDEVRGSPYYRATNGSYPYIVNPSDIGSWANNGTAEMVVIGNWSQYRGRISDYSGTTLYFKSPESGFAYNHHSQGSAPYFLENDLALLDAEGEWFLDTANTTLYYKPRSGETMNTTTVIAPNVETLVNIEGIGTSNRAHHIQFYGITFKHANWLAPSSYGYVDVQAGFRYQSVSGGSATEIWGTSRYSAARAMLQLKYTSHISLELNTFTFGGAWGIMGYEGTDHTSILRNTVTKLASGAIAMGIVEGVWGADDSSVSQYDTIADNMVDTVGYDYKGTVGIGTMLCQNMTIARNEVKNLPYTGISIGWNWNDTDYGMTNNQVFSNRIHDIMKLLDDGGGIYSLGRMDGNSSIYNNYIYRLTRSSYSAGNPIAGIYIESGSCYKKAESNVLNDAINAFYAYNPPNYDNIIQYNHYNCNLGTISDSNTVIGNTSVSGQNWSQEALDIMNSTGPGSSILVTPSSLNFGYVLVGSTKDLILTIKNRGIVTLTGSATTAAPFSIVSGESYSLGPDQEMIVTVRYQPTFPGTNTGTLVFTGGTGTTIPITGLSDCSGGVVVFQDVTFVSGNTYNCTASSITTGTGVTVQSGATVNFRAPIINLQPGFRLESGAVFSAAQ